MGSMQKKRLFCLFLGKDCSKPKDKERDLRRRSVVLLGTGDARMHRRPKTVAGPGQKCGPAADNVRTCARGGRPFLATISAQIHP